jgi:hypothetical protein
VGARNVDPELGAVVGEVVAVGPGRPTTSSVLSCCCASFATIVTLPFGASSAIVKRG